ncbi:putative 60S ribosomal protein L5 [Histomonas meleagridis]|uniref:putative 60S ribosomal protein L5 n=1 Tax=Histomonas meleagridis TaxID=135588 RepID=UPI00355A9584|nr:putative 60S ribosomal protein L5 [Histomonas meleagridis]KAH0798941.1 putative 60S ribosomal protein L5 [Histomonas meleagridis]
MSAKIIKNSSYFSRYQTPFRRRRECKTDYVQRSSLIQQDKTKYGAKKYRLVARITNTKVIAQIVYAELDHDVTMAQAQSTELVKYGIKLGLANYPAAYCTGLLVARRLLKKLGLDEIFKTAVNPEEEDEDARRPFKVLLDVGLRRTTTGARVFGVMKGAVDGGLFVPHSDTRIAGGEKEKKQRYFILGGHIVDYMKKLKSENEDAYKRQFSRYIKEGIAPENLEKIYTEAHKAIRANPDPAPKATTHYQLKKPHAKRLSPEERKRLLNERLAAAGLPPRN